MSSYKLIYLLILSILITGCNTTKPLPNMYKSYYENDTLIVIATDLELNHNYVNALEVYEKLYKKNRLSIYENKIIRLSTMVGKYERAIGILTKRLDKSQSKIDLELLSAIYFSQKKYQKSLKIQYQIYELYKDNLSALKIVELLSIYLNRVEDALSYIETYTRIYGCFEELCKRKLTIYASMKNFEKLTETYNLMYEKLKKIEYANKVVDIYLYQKRYMKALQYLELNRVDDILLFDLYKRTKNIKKAYKLAELIYKKTSKADFLAQSGILEYEVASDKKSVLLSVEKKLTKALKSLDNPTYNNYLGYLLIDHDLDIKRGMIYVNKALKNNPNSPYYLDSLAWGYYKLNDIENAYQTMKKVVDILGEEDEEVKKHWVTIKGKK